MGLLAIEFPVVLYRSIPPPVTHSRQRVVSHRVREGPSVKRNWLERRDPGMAAGWDGTVCTANRQPNRHKMGMAGKSHVDSLLMPTLNEGGIKVQISAHRNVANDILVG